MPKLPAEGADAPAPWGGGLPSGRFDGREAFRGLVRDALACAAREGWPELVLSDAQFGDWPLGERSVTESLEAWAGGGRRFVLLAGGFDEIVRAHPRFVHWRGTWGHIVECRRAATSSVELPSALWSPGWALHRLDPQRCAGVSGSEPERCQRLRESLDEWLLRRSSPGFPATTLGL